MRDALKGRQGPQGLKERSELKASAALPGYREKKANQELPIGRFDGNKWPCLFKELANVFQQSSHAIRMVCAANCNSRDARAVARLCNDRSTMERSMITSRFGKKIRLPSTVQIKHQLLLMWLADQEKEEARTERVK